MYLYELLNVKNSRVAITIQTRDKTKILPQYYNIITKLCILDVTVDRVHELSVTLDVCDEDFEVILKVNEALSILAQECENTECNSCRFYNMRAYQCELRMCSPRDYTKFI